MARFATSPLACTGCVAALTLCIAACGPKVTAPPEPPMSVTRGDQAFRYEDYPAAINSYRTYLNYTEHGVYTARVYYKIALAQYRLGEYRDTLATLDELGRRYPNGHWVQVEALRGDAERELGHATMAIHAWDTGWEYANESDHPKLRQRIAAVARGLSDADLVKARHVVASPGVQALLDRQIALRKPSALNEESPGTGEAKSGDLAAAERPVPAKNHTDMSGPKSTTSGGSGAPPAKKAAAVGRVEGPAERPSTTETLPEPDAGSAPEASARPPSAALHEPPPRAATEPQPAVAPEVDLPPLDAPALAPQERDEPIRGTPRLGCLLPLSGSDQEAGQRSLDGLRLVFTADRLVVKDTASDPAVAAVTFDGLAHDPSIIAVVGPLRADDTDTVAPLAERAQLPALLLASPHGTNGRFAIPTGLNPSREISELLGYVMPTLRVKRFGVLYPKNVGGEESLSAFRAAVEERGGTVIGADGYAPGSGGAPVGTVKHWHTAQNLQALFVPDTAIAAQRIARFLQREMPDVPLLGIQDWQTLADAAPDDDLNGIVFVDGFYADSARSGTRAFVNRFVQAYGKTPGALEAQAYDAGLLVKRAMDAGKPSRLNLLRALEALEPIEGATGTLHVGLDGVHREMFLLQVFDGKLREVGSAG